MKTNKFMGSLLFGGALGLIAVPAWSQYGAGQSSSTPITKEPQTPPGAAPRALGTTPKGTMQNRADQSSSTPITKEPQTPPGAAPKGALRLSKQDIHEVQQALKEKGYKPGTSSSLDNKTKDAIRAFQKDHNLPVTGTIDERTSEELGVQLQSSTSSSSSSTHMR